MTLRRWFNRIVDALTQNKSGLHDPRLPVKAIAGLCNVVPYNCITTQIHTANWPWDSGCFFLEIKGCWYEKPPMEAIILSSDDGVRGNFRPLTGDEQMDALEFFRTHWPEKGADPHVTITTKESKS